jgi:hypothetical protein
MSLVLVTGLIVCIFASIGGFIFFAVVGRFVVIVWLFVVHSCGGVPSLGGVVGKIVIGRGSIIVIRVIVVIPVGGEVAGIIRISNIIIEVDDGGAVPPGK